MKRLAQLLHGSESAAELRARIAVAEAARDRGREEVVLLQAVLQGVDGAVLAVTADHRRLYANRGAERLFQLEAGSDRVPGLGRFPQLAAWIAQALAGGAASAAHSDRVPLADGRTLQVFVAPLPSQPPGCVVVARDVSETVRLETARRDFIAALSHELRTPLTSLQGYAEILQDNPDLPAPTRNQFLGVMQHNTERLSRLARDLVTLSSIETGTYPFHFQELDAAALLPPAVAVMEPLALEHRSRIVVEELPPGRVLADGEALHRVLLNLIENAILHGASPAAGVTVTLRGERRGGEYVLQVRDDGPGIGWADQRRVFERFYRVRTRDEGGRHGTGLGLALVKHILREHGGGVELASALGAGSTFTIRLPLAPPAAAAAPAPDFEAVRSNA